MAQRAIGNCPPEFVRRLYEGATDLLAPARSRMREAARKASPLVAGLLATREGLLKEIPRAKAPEEWARPAQDLLAVEARLRSAVYLLSPLLTPGFGKPGATVEFLYDRGKRTPPAEVLARASAWLGENVAPAVIRAAQRGGDGFGGRGTITHVSVLAPGEAGGRPYCDGEGIHVFRDTPDHVYAHEFGHVVEDRVPKVLAAATVFLAKVATGPKQKVSQLMARWAPEDDVRLGPADPYWGRVPGKDRHTEVIAGGFGAMMWEPGVFYVSDPLHYGLVASVMAGDYL